MQETERQGSLFYVFGVATIAAVGGLLFGYDTAVISGAVPFLEEYFSLTAGQLGFAVSSVVLGCILGASIAGSLADRFGRKKVMIVAAAMFLASAILTSLPKSLILFNLARFIGGLAIGLSSPVSPTYIAEISPARIRGALVTLNQLAITFGIVAAYFADWWIAGQGGPQWQTDYAWRWMFASECVPALILLVGLLFIPESPRWLLKSGSVEKATHIFTRIGGPSHAKREINEIAGALSMEEASLSQLFRPGFRRALVIGVMIMIFSQITGMNAIYMYTPKLLLAVGFASKESALLAMVLVGVVNFATTIIAVCILDRVGRRVLMLLAPAGMGLCMLAIAVGYGFQWISPAVILAAILVFVFCFALGVGPGAWLVTSEIYPTKVRGRAMSICTFSLWTSSFMANLVFPKLLRFSQVTTFALFAVACFAMLIFIYIFLPETKGKTLEEIEALWAYNAPTGEPPE